jgi:hypothetical protein
VGYKREKEIAKPFVVVPVATGFSDEGDVDFKFENPSGEREEGGVVEQGDKGGGGRSFSGVGERWHSWRGYGCMWRRVERGAYAKYSFQFLIFSKCLYLCLDYLITLYHILNLKQHP